MAVLVQTPSPNQLLQTIRGAIDQGHIKTWTYDRDGDFTHTPDQWRGKAWLRPVAQNGTLKFGIIGPNQASISKAVYGVYHGRWIEELLTHFDTVVGNISATPLPVHGLDSVAA